jgi:hypothetical protein
VAFPKDRSVPYLRESATRGDRTGVVVAETAIVRRVGWRDFANRLAAACTGACYECALACTASVKACLAEGATGLKRCIWVCQNNADVCVAVGRLLARTAGANAEELSPILRVCILACRMAREECERQAEVLPTSRRTAETAARCVLACSQLQSALAASP